MKADDTTWGGTAGGAATLAPEAPAVPEVPTVPPAPDLSRPPRPAWQTRPVGYVRALDGVRAVAVGLVVAYHLGYAGVPGGYVGVEVFFVLSGWLVCALLVNEHHRTGGIRLGAFWLRRARRLLPAVVVVTVSTLAVAAVARPDTLAELRTQAVAALGYHQNWRLILDQQSYFESAAGPSALEHLWSLSIEEQFYLAFPLLAGFVLVWTSRRRAIALVVGVAVASTVLRMALASPGTDPSRLYFGSDTRAAGLPLGVALALFWTPNRLRSHDDRRFTLVLDVAAAAGAATVLWYALRVSETDTTAFRFGFTAAQLGTLVLIAVAVYPAPTVTARLLSARGLSWVGKRSYGIYLVHWPVIVFLSRAPGEQPGSTATVVVEVALVLGLSALLYRWVEQPVRRRGVAGAARHARDRLAALTARRDRPGLALGLRVVAVVALLGGAALARVVVGAEPPTATQPASVAIGPGEATTTTAAERAAPSPATTAAPPASSASSAPLAMTPVPTTTPPPPAPPPMPTVTAIGDSVMVGGADALAARIGPTLTVDAAVGRQLVDAGGIVADLAGRGQLGRVIVLGLGANGPFTGEQVDELFGVIGPDHTVLLVNVLVPRRWEGEVNDALAAAAGRHPNAVLVDWRSVVTAEPGLTESDGFHLTAIGAERYADTIVAAIPRG
jgi:peptidoglycan/LPS O-acetylase OafA/YrhL